MTVLVGRAFNPELPIGLIDPPVLDARIDRDPEKLEELAHDLSHRGMIFPMAVVRVGERYEVVDGQRRYLAAKRANFVVVPAFIYPTKAAALEGVKYAANAFREDMTAAEEAVFFQQLYDHECQHDVDQICALVNRKRAYVEGRLLLVQGHEEVFEALRRREISIGVAQILNRLEDPQYVHYFCVHAIRQSASVTTVDGWVTAHLQTLVETPARPGDAGAAGDQAPIAVLDPNVCLCCGDGGQQELVQFYPFHQSCKRAIVDKLLAAYHGEPVPHV